MKHQNLQLLNIINVLFLQDTVTHLSEKICSNLYQSATLNQQLLLETAVCPWIWIILDPLKRPLVVKESKNTKGHAISEMVY